MSIGTVVFPSNSMQLSRYRLSGKDTVIQGSGVAAVRVRIVSPSRQYDLDHHSRLVVAAQSQFRLQRLRPVDQALR